MTYTYADIYGGKVRDIREFHLGYTEFCSIFDPASYWLDVTGVENVGVGYVIRFSPERGTYFEAPPLPETPEETLETKRAAKLEMLSLQFEQASEQAYIDSSLGFRADADETAYRDVDGLIVLLSDQPDQTVSFCDYDNLMQSLMLEQLRVLQKEIARNGTYLYQQKWALRESIESAESAEELDGIVIAFANMSFEPPAEEEGAEADQAASGSENGTDAGDGAQVSADENGMETGADGTAVSAAAGDAEAADGTVTSGSAEGAA